MLRGFGLERGGGGRKRREGGKGREGGKREGGRGRWGRRREGGGKEDENLKDKKWKKKRKKEPTKTVVIKPLSYIQILSPSILGHQPRTPQAITYIKAKYHLQDHNNLVIILSLNVFLFFVLLIFCWWEWRGWCSRRRR